MSQERPFLTGPMLPSVLAGAALGALVVALTTPKTGPELRGDLKDLTGCGKRKAGELAEGACESFDDMKKRTTLALADLKRGLSDAADDLSASSSGKATKESGPETGNTRGDAPG